MYVVTLLALSILCFIWIVVNYRRLLQIRNGKRIMVYKKDAPKPADWQIEVINQLKKYDRISAAKYYAIIVGKPHWIKVIKEVVKIEKLYLIEIINPGK